MTTFDPFAPPDAQITAISAKPKPDYEYRGGKTLEDQGYLTATMCRYALRVQRSVDKAADYLGVSRATLRARLRDADLAEAALDRAHLVVDQGNKILAMRAEGRTWPQVCAAMGMTASQCQYRARMARARRLDPERVDETPRLASEVERMKAERPPRPATRRRLDPETVRQTLMRTASVAETARQLGCSVRSVYHLVPDPADREALARIRRDREADLMDRVADLRACDLSWEKIGRELGISAYRARRLGRGFGAALHDGTLDQQPAVAPRHAQPLGRARAPQRR